MLLWFAIDDLRRFIAARRAAHMPSSIVVAVEGMTCGGCVRRLERLLNELEEVDSATVSLDPGQAMVNGTASAARIEEVITEAGFVVPAA